MQILDKFPIEGGQKDPKKRIIPFLPGKSQAAVLRMHILVAERQRQDANFRLFPSLLTRRYL